MSPTSAIRRSCWQSKRSHFKLQVNVRASDLRTEGLVANLSTNLYYGLRARL